jgi:hypothetical protein
MVATTAAGVAPPEEAAARARAAALQQDLVASRTRAEASRTARQVNWVFMSPLAFAAALPLIRIGLRNQPRLRDIVWRGTLGIAFLHGTALAAGFYDSDSSKRAGSH